MFKKYSMIHIKRAQNKFEIKIFNVETVPLKQETNVVPFFGAFKVLFCIHVTEMLAFITSGCLSVLYM